MKKILDTILQIEEESKAQVQEAQQKARDMKESAERENAQRLDQRVLLSQDAMMAEFLNAKKSEIENTVEKIFTIIKTPLHKYIDE